MSKPAMQTITLRLRKTQVKALDRLAKTTGRSRSWHLQQAVDAYLAEQKWIREQIRQGIAEMDAGLGIPHEDIVREFRNRQQIRQGIADMKAGRTVPHEEIVKEFLHTPRTKRAKK